MRLTLHHNHIRIMIPLMQLCRASHERIRVLNLLSLLFKNRINLSDDIYMHSSLPVVSSSRSYVGISTISNNPVVGFIIVLQVRPTLFLMIAPHVCCCLIDFLYDLLGPHAPNLTFLVLLLS